MSLLLDALKKAADDKEKSSRDHPSDTPDSSRKELSEDLAPDQSREQLLDEKSPSESEADVVAETETDVAAKETDELTLDLEEMPSADDAQVETVTEHPDSVQQDSGQHDSVQQTSEQKNTYRQDGHQRYRRATGDSSDKLALETMAESPRRLSNDALSLLIDKTNQEVKKRNRVSIAVLVIATAVILVSGGAYYYTDMQTEIAAIERKHQIAMQAMRTKTSREETPQQSAIIKNLVSDADLEQKVEYAKAQMQSDIKQAPDVTAPVANKNKTVTAELSIKRTKKIDPVAEKLDSAWLAYDSGRYDTAAKLYEEILEIEGNNRDALLGLGAIAVIKKEEAQARQIYLSLLQQDPRDPIATAALSGLSGDESSLAEDNEYLMSMLEKNPDAPHLNFSLANNFAQQNKWKSAQQYYFKAWQHDIDNADYLFNLAVSMDQLDKPEQALGFYRDSLNKAKDRQVSFSREAVQKRIDELTQL
jgi:tetratricopeptide (TPR) repeat protein